MKHIVLVVTDSALFKAYRLERTNFNTPRLELLEEIPTPNGHTKLLDRVSDQAGRYHAPTSGKWSTPWGERHNIQLEQRKRSIRQLAEQLERLLRSDEVEGCYLAASKEINHQILDGLESHLRAKITRNLTADLTKLDRSELLERFSVAPRESGIRPA